MGRDRGASCPLGFSIYIYIYMDVLMKEVKMGMGSKGEGNLSIMERVN